jgi:hypothetical protein
VLTDYALAAVALALGLRLLRVRSRVSAPARLWAASFAALAAAALVGGTWHAVPPEAAPALRRLLWSATYVAIGAADFLLLAGAARAALGRTAASAAVILLCLRLLVYAILVVSTRDFRHAAIEFGGTLLLLSAFAADLARRRERAAPFVLGAIVVSLAGGLVLLLGLELHPRFNDNDLFHVVQTGAVWLLFRGALLLPAGRARARLAVGISSCRPAAAVRS